jgi:hypothetical protein
MKNVECEESFDLYCADYLNFLINSSMKSFSTSFNGNPSKAVRDIRTVEQQGLNGISLIVMLLEDVAKLESGRRIWFHIPSMLYGFLLRDDQS